MKTDLRSLTFHELEAALENLGEEGFRAKQVFPWLHKTGVSSFDEMANVPKTLRENLSRNYELTSLKRLKVQVSKDGTKKYLWGLPDGNTVESVLLDDEGRKTVCLSTQIGCKMNCSFCATAKVKFKRNLTAGEIVSQVIEIEKENGNISNLVYMGMGEPLDNYDNVLKSVRILNHPLGKTIGQRKITISTCGIVPEIERFANEDLQVRLAVSLNAPNDAARNRLMPINKKYPIEKILHAVEAYTNKTGRRVTVEYAMIKGENDSIKDAEELAKLLKGARSNINLIAFNPFEGCRLLPSPAEAIKQFRQILEAAGFEVAQRFRRGVDIDAACGQLTGKYEAQK
jgi:23S rRNA (adenine2503-C2)-methyltransferase